MLELNYNTTSYSPGELTAFQGMICQQRLSATDFDTRNAITPASALRITKTFQEQSSLTRAQFLLASWSSTTCADSIHDLWSAAQDKM